MELDKKISWGNIVTWIIIAASFFTGWGNLTSATRENAKDVAEAKAFTSEKFNEVKTMAVAAQESNKQSEVLFNSQITALNVALAETKVTVTYMDKKIDELVADLRNRRQQPTK